MFAAFIAKTCTEADILIAAIYITLKILDNYVNRKHIFL